MQFAQQAVTAVDQPPVQPNQLGQRFELPSLTEASFHECARNFSPVAASGAASHELMRRLVGIHGLPVSQEMAVLEGPPRRTRLLPMRYIRLCTVMCCVRFSHTVAPVAV